MEAETNRDAGAETLEILADLAQMLGTARDLVTVFRALRDFALAATPSIGMFVSLYDTARDVRTAAYAWGDGEEADVSQLPPMPVTETGLNSRAMRTGEVVVADHEPHAGGIPVGPDNGLRPRSALIVPMAVFGRIVGTVEVQSYEEAAYRPAHVTALRMAANLAAVAIENVRLFERESRARAEAEETLRVQREVEEKLTLLVEASQSLLGSLRLDSVLPSILDLSRRLISADAYAIWRYEPQRHLWKIVSAAGLSPDYREAPVPVTDETPDLRDVPVAVEDLYGEPLYSERYEVWRREGIRSMLTLPLKIRGENCGTLVFYYRRPHRFDEIEVRVGSALANLAASAIGTAELYAEAEESARRSAFLAEAASALASSLDYSATLRSVARLAVPHIADWCSVEVLEDDGRVEQLAVEHVDPSKVEWACALRGRYPPDPEAPTGVPNVLRTGRSELYAEVTDEMLAAAAKDDEHLRILREVGFCSAMIVPLRAHARTLGAITFVTTCESDRHYDAADLAFAEDLARRAALAVANARLYEATERANRLKDEFLATVSHELRTPLTAITGWAHMLRRESLDRVTAERALEIIERNARAQAQLVDDLLDVSRIITGKVRLDARPTALAPVAEAAVESLRPAAEAKGIELRVELAPDAGTVLGSPERLQQVVWNLLSNAIKFTPRGGRIRLGSERRGANVQLSVSDTGEGIAPEFLPHVFERFRQADATTTRRHGGLGLGLAIVRHLVELHGGTVSAESEGAGRGATFNVCLPLLETREADCGLLIDESAADVNDQSAIRNPQSAILRGLRLLVVDDDADAREMLVAILTHYGAEARACASAAEALRSVERSRPDVLLSDIGMPGEDGYVLIGELRSRGAERGGRVPALALTAYARDEDRLRALASGYQEHLPKPVNPAELAQTVARLAGRNGT